MDAKITRSVNPEALEFPFKDLTFYTPNELFYVRNHFPTPAIDPASWSLSVEGKVRKILTVNYEELQAMPSRTVGATLECAGNSRDFLSPPVPGVQWNLGGISSAEWTGVPLAHVLELAGLEAEAVDIMFEGADSGTIAEAPKPAGTIHYARSLPREKALDKDVLLAYAMNGERLTPAHGFPLRLIVPGWFAVASVKWLTRIVASNSPFQGYFQTIDYGYWDRSAGHPQRKVITEMLVKAQIASPQMHEKVAGRSPFSVRGAAWSGSGKIARVEVSTDGGASWDLARITSENSFGLWCLWDYDWQVPDPPGECVLLARATDEKGNSQPLSHDQDRETYLINHCLPITVMIE